MLKQALFATVAAISLNAWADNSIVEMKTNQGTIEIELYNDKAPISAKNFEDYIKADFYRGTIFHRVIPGFMIQGGGMDAQMAEKQTRAPIKNESYNGLKNLRGTLAMARTNDPNSASSQFFINTVDNDFLNKSAMNAGYAVFGKVIKGMDVVDKIEKVPTVNRGVHQNVPQSLVLIQSVKIKAPAAQKNEK
ncbi:MULTISPECIES: peptidylprolyl isomerase [Acinetobacter]|jgi:peptidyl-prolyl cis-trans isomerase A (cyclophilin A)|uniref:Peptidyl-prolyl cis-trans isomerase n=2 Tax=Acinetobacter TaxID=469 RepID=A0A4Q7AV45_9GAMM|nr:MULTISPECIES: peptidylprolyl isomerase [Acinetobacter]MCW8040619.1 peptidylprolyl isomerase [Acinetobacter entericus]QXW25991.1 peptidylprolyl isomerase [Acinetobacter johnsonii]RZG64299.1 peptidylprolyl isomerase A [Acinetobacter bouvetii]TCB70828.1 peptidylprolyl isomerase A [Acinetobacter sp. ANC 4177]